MFVRGQQPVGCSLYEPIVAVSATFMLSIYLSIYVMLCYVVSAFHCAPQSGQARSIHPTYITLHTHRISDADCSSQGTDKEGRGVFIEGSDVRAKRMARKAGSLIIFIVDASGSMALNRMNAAKGAAMSLLQEAYQSRDKICIVPFQVRDRSSSDCPLFIIVQGH